MNSDDTLTVLFLCTGNSARSIMAEAILNKLGAPRFKAHSAGSRPAEKVHPVALEILASMHYPTGSLHSKSWLDFTYMSSPNFDLVIILCNAAASEKCPVWPGDPVKVEWCLPDPTATSTHPVEQLKAFAKTFQLLEHRIRQLVTLPPGPFTREALEKHLLEMAENFA